MRLKLKTLSANYYYKKIGDLNKSPTINFLFTFVQLV